MRIKIFHGKIITVLLLIFCSHLKVVAQESYPLESEAIRYFCSNVKAIDSELKDAKIIIPKKSEKRQTNIFELADAVHDINLMKDSVPNRSMLENLESSLNKAQNISKKLIISKSCKKELRSSSNGLSFTMQTFNGVNYNGSAYVELLFINKISKWHTSVFVKFDSGKAVGHYKRSVVYD